MRTLADIAPEGILLAGAGRAILLQIALPGVGRGVVEHSDFAARPMKRLTATLSYIYALSNGTPDDARRMRAAVNRAHAPVHGDPTRSAPAYDAHDPALQLWVAATLYDTAISLYERTFGPLGPEEGERVYREYARLGTDLQMPLELWPADRAAFRAYLDSTLATLSVDPAVSGVATALFRAENAPRWLRAVMPLARFVTVGLLPPNVRELYGFDWSVTHERRLRRTLGGVSAVYRVLPAAVRRWPQRHYLAGLRRTH
ncbi:DUF2236 domain-containing protein [Herbiconiux moechotypicola]|uniref:Oxygenase MpaB family protein n=1 Tax=Herbiconiux moechotypicola TaxID=637393 RepID=A0ABN3D8D8_9MICO|nr:oxygenase MpaB family protein [Herbiconiux moechotypicola]MCS5728260.1 DUF2236 domain-containing protein [Herbiconiux moechotypicola]